MIPRIIPVLLIDDGGVVKTTKFRDARYVGDPINAVRIFNDKQVDELVVLDIGATRLGRPPDERMLAQIAEEAFMPLAYGGGVRDLQTATRLIQIGIEKIIVNTAAIDAPAQVARMADRLGSSTLVVSIDARRNPDGGYETIVGGGLQRTGIEPRAHAEAAARIGAGEVFLTSIDRDGTMEGYDLELVRRVTTAVDVPVIASGGAGRLEDFAAVVQSAGAAAAAAGSLFVFHGRHRAVLITYPPYGVRSALFGPAQPT